jgi:putative selenium metabolism hydrolase
MLPDKIIHYIEERTDWLIEQTVEFIKTAGASGSEGAVADTLISCLERSGQRTFKDEAGNVVAAFERMEPRGCGRKTLAFNVHLDTVPPGMPESWKHDPFSGTVEDDKIFGRGASDTKGAWAPIILAMEAVMNSGVSLDGRMVFTAVVMEELGLCAGMKHLLETTFKDSLPDYMILGEPTSLNIAVGHKGKTEFQITTHGRACHASVPWQGANALYAAAPAIASIEKLAREIGSKPEDPRFGRTTFALTDIVCNPGVRNVIPDLCTMFLDCRILPGETPEGIKSRIERHFLRDGIRADVCPSTENMLTYTGLRINGEKFIPAFELNELHPLVTAAAQAVSEAHLKNPKIYRWDFATDGGWSMGKLGIPTIGFSPCEENLAHTVDEYVRIDYMKAAAKAYAAIIIRILGLAGT